MTTPRNGEAPGAYTGGNPQDQQGHADDFSLSFLGTETFCGTHERARYSCGCGWLDVRIDPAHATFTAVIDPRRSDLVTQLREAHQMPAGLPVVIEAGNSKPSKAFAVDRDAWVRLAVTRRIDVRCTPVRIREWRRAVAELGGVV